jgi:radical SAM superfamily enzyme YgiQ (UPF0313 family)
MASETGLNKGKIVLFRGRPNTDPRLPTFLPLGLLAVAAPLDKEGYEIIIVDAVMEKNYVEMVLNNVEGAICLGIGTMTGYQIKEGLEVAYAVGEKYPDVPIVWGGFHPSILPGQTAEHPLVDIVVVGQGERTFQELVHCIQDKTSLKDVQGIVYKENGKIIENPLRPFENLDNFPSYAFHVVDVNRYIFESEAATRTVNYVSSYGCVHKCTFCAEMKMFKRRWLPRSTKAVVDDIENLVKIYGVNGVYMQDNNFFQDPERARGICEEIIRRGLKVKWCDANGRTNILSKMDDSWWSLIKEAGCYSILVGAESGSQEVLNFIDKGATVEDSFVVARNAAKYGIKVFWSLMLGFPHSETFSVPIEEEFDKTLSMVIKINKISTNHKILWFLLTPYPETPIYELCKRLGFKGYDSLDGWAAHDLTQEHELLRSSPWIPEKYVGLLSQLNTFVFPYASSLYLYMTNAAGKKKFKYLTWLFPIVALVFHWSATFRLNHKFFSFPLEYNLIKTLLKYTQNLQC